MKKNLQIKNSKKIPSSILNIFILTSVIVISLFSFSNSKNIGDDEVLIAKIAQFNRAVDVYLKTEGVYPNTEKGGQICIAPEGEKCYFGDLEIEAESLVGTDFGIFLKKRNLFENNSIVSASSVVKDYVDYHNENNDNKIKYIEKVLEKDIFRNATEKICTVEID